VSTVIIAIDYLKEEDAITAMNFTSLKMLLCVHSAVRVGPVGPGEFSYYFRLCSGLALLHFKLLQFAAAMQVD